MGWDEGIQGDGRRENGVANVLRPPPEYANAHQRKIFEFGVILKNTLIFEREIELFKFHWQTIKTCMLKATLHYIVRPPVCPSYMKVNMISANCSSDANFRPRLCSSVLGKGQLPGFRRKGKLSSSKLSSSIICCCTAQGKRLR